MKNNKIVPDALLWLFIGITAGVSPARTYVFLALWSLYFVISGILQMLGTGSETRISPRELFALAGLFIITASKGYLAGDLAAWIYLVGIGVVRLSVALVQNNRVPSVYARVAVILAACLPFAHLWVWHGQSWASSSVAIVYSVAIVAYGTVFSGRS